MEPIPLDDVLDALVAEYADRLAAGAAGDPTDLLNRVPPLQRATLERCLRMMRAGLAAAPRASVRIGPGFVLDGYEIVREIGRGGMSVVYLAMQRDLRRHVALKVLRPGLALDARHVDRFEREALSIARLQHPHIVQVYAVGEALGYHYLAMEFIEGKNFAQVLAELPRVHRERVASAGERASRGARGWSAADLAVAAGVPALARGDLTYEQALAELLAPVARAIGVAHEIGLVHRDIKPSNILIHKDGRALIADFGLAKGQGDPGLSLTGEPLGTPYYMSPEQAAITTVPIDERTDVYSLGVTLYEALSGHRPFEGEGTLAVLEAIRSTPPAPLSRVENGAGVPSRDAHAIVERAMARDPGLRYARVLDLASDLALLATGQPTRARAQIGGARHRALRELRRLCSGEFYEYRSQRTFLGLPLVHVFTGRNHGRTRLRVARGWIAIGDVAFGGLALGQVASGIVSFGGIASGGLCFGGIGVGVVSFGGIACGVVAFAGLALAYAAIGGVAIGTFALGGRAFGAHVISGAVQDPIAVEFFRGAFPWLGRWVGIH